MGGPSALVLLMALCGLVAAPAVWVTVRSTRLWHRYRRLSCSGEITRLGDAATVRHDMSRPRQMTVTEHEKQRRYLVVALLGASCALTAFVILAFLLFVFLVAGPRIGGFAEIQQPAAVSRLADPA